ncbi:hypothetical protein ACFPVY_09005 [Flavobacterium qiangtangense]|uniref:Addiction module protein n=1 Tax=Flavobacterium qiangtangense TaxID=1442595 RepID=A0ABW1PNE9_9FLAO
MATISLQQQIIEQISEIEDITLLEKIKTILDSSKYQLSQDQISLVNEAENQYEKGEFIDDQAMDEKFKEWQKK